MDYYRSIYLMNRVDFLDNGVALVKRGYVPSPVRSELFFMKDILTLGMYNRQLAEHEEEIQCIVSLHPEIPGRLATRGNTGAHALGLCRWSGHPYVSE